MFAPYSALDFADQYRAVAQDRRNRGAGAGGGGRVFKSNRALYAARGGTPAPGSTDRFIAELRLRWRNARDEAIEAYRFAVFLERYETFEL